MQALSWIVSVVVSVVAWGAFLLIPAALVIVTLVRGLMLPRSLRAARGPVCGVCSHGIAETPGLFCAECGTPYRVGGMQTALLVRRHRPGVWTTIACWTSIAAFGSTVVVGIVSSAMWSMSSGNYTYTIQETSHQTFDARRDDAGRPTDQPGYSLRIDADITHDYSNVAKAGTARFTIRPDNGPAVTATVDVVSRAWSAETPSGRIEGDRFNFDAAAEILGAAGVVPGSAYANLEARQIADAVNHLYTSPGTAHYDDYGITDPTLAAATSANEWLPIGLASSMSLRDNGRVFAFRFSPDSGYDAASGPAYEGSAEFEVDRGNAPAVRGLTLTLAPSTGWPATLAYDPETGSGTLTREHETTEPRTWSSHEDAVRALAVHAGLDADADDTVQRGVEQVADLIDTMEVDPLHYAAPQIFGSSAVADGEPDGGLVSTNLGQSNQTYPGAAGAPFSGPDIPLLVWIAGAVCTLVWLAGIWFIVRWRRRLFSRITPGAGSDTPAGPPPDAPAHTPADSPPDIPPGTATA